MKPVVSIQASPIEVFFSNRHIPGASSKIQTEISFTPSLVIGKFAESFITRAGT
jgi:hypothetical protein